MAGPVIEALREQLNSDEDDSPPVRKRLEESPLMREHSKRLRERMDTGGGCCNAAMAAEAMRRKGKEFR